MTALPMLMSGTVRTEHEKYDAQVALWERWPRGVFDRAPAAIFNYVCSDEFRDAQVSLSLSYAGNVRVRLGTLLKQAQELGARRRAKRES